LDDDLRRRVERVEAVLDDGRFVRKETYEADQRAQERTDLAQERRFSEVGDAIKTLADRVDAGFAEAREDRSWLRRQLITMLFGIIAAVITAAVVAAS
jgi:ribosome-binding protein aMBF1 (putative translation factor)